MRKRGIGYRVASVLLAVSLTMTSVPVMADNEQVVQEEVSDEENVVSVGEKENTKAEERTAAETNDVLEEKESTEEEKNISLETEIQTPESDNKEGESKMTEVEQANSETLNSEKEQQPSEEMQAENIEKENSEAEEKNSPLETEKQTLESNDEETESKMTEEEQESSETQIYESEEEIQKSEEKTQPSEEIHTTEALTTQAANEEVKTGHLIWFDGTMGLGELPSKNNGTNKNPNFGSWYFGAKDVKVRTKGNKVVLPSSAGDTIRYGYKLRGWYDITHGKYYGSDMFGKEIEIESDAVFYADWVAADYNFGTDKGCETVKNQPDTSNFIHTTMFDFNELFNILSARLSKSNITEEGHKETWSFVNQGEELNADTDLDGKNESGTSLGFLFLNWAYYTITKAMDNDADKSIGYVDGIPKDNKVNQNRSEITAGIVSDSDGNVTEAGRKLLNQLFSESDGLGKTFVGKGNFLYQYINNKDDENDGYYYYDSGKNGLSYNQDEERFYIYTKPEYVQGEQLGSYSNGWMQWNKTDYTSTGMLPFNDSSKQDNATDMENGGKGYNANDGSINYWFGMKSTVGFWLPNQPGTEGANKATTGKDMEFKFSGDDDVWVFVDDKLVLDLGGIHGKKSGSINFSKGTVLTDGKETALSDLIGEGDHTLSVYYLERGSAESNCSIYFNIAPRYSLTIDKLDSDTENPLEQAEFSIYTDESCSESAQLWDSLQDCNNKKPSKNVFTTGKDGKLNCYGLVAGKTYYLRETSSPSGYEDKSGNVIKLTVNADGTITVTSADGTMVSQNDVSSNLDIKQLLMKIRNTRKKTDPEEPKKDDPKEEEPKKDDPKEEEPKKDDPKEEEPKKDDPKKDDPKEEESEKVDPREEYNKEKDPKKKNSEEETADGDSESETSEENSENHQNPDTGDHTNILLWLFLLCGTALTLMELLLRRYKHR